MAIVILGETSRRIAMRSLLLLLPALFLGSPEATITEISLQRSPCFGTCPIDKVVLRSDGTARYTGTRFVERLGDYSGKIGVDEFKRLAKLIDDTSFVTFKDRYTSRGQDLRIIEGLELERD
jgi:hypothetical protein